VLVEWGVIVLSQAQAKLAKNKKWFFWLGQVVLKLGLLFGLILKWQWFVVLVQDW